MPFDNPQQLNQEMIYRQRRDSAIALWATIPDWSFSIRRWREITPCGTVCCAIGWLSEKQHDGWWGLKDVPRWELKSDYDAAAAYFGITNDESYGLFTASRESRWGERVSEVSLNDISEALRSLPITYKRKGNQR